MSTKAGTFQARIGVFHGPIDGRAAEEGIVYTVPVQNAPDSSGAASRITVELVDPQKRTVGTSAQVERLVPGERAFVGVRTPPRDRYTGPYEIVFEWGDGRPKRNRLASGATVGEPAWKGRPIRASIRASRPRKERRLAVVSGERTAALTTSEMARASGFRLS